MTIFIPAAYWLYKKHNGVISKKSEESSLKKGGWITRWVSNPAKNFGTADGLGALEIPACKYLLIGGGAASFAAMKEILSLEPEADILIITEESVHPMRVHHFLKSYGLPKT
jgi:hypothetical protein